MVTSNINRYIKVNNIDICVFIPVRMLFLNSYSRFRFAISIYTVCWFITFPLFKFRLIWHTNQTTENSKMLFLNKPICNFILQVIRNFKVEYDYEMKYKHTFLRMPATPLKFRMVDREGWRRPIHFSAVTMTEFEYVMWFDIFACKTEIKNSDINCNRFFRELNLVKEMDHEKYTDKNLWE